jgi:ketosteroid isomerase-like protein
VTNRKIVETTFGALQRRDFDAAFAHMAPQYEFDNRTDAPGAMGVWKGRDGFLAMMGKVVEAFSEYSVDVLDAEEQGDEVTLIVREASRGKVSGIAMERRLRLTYTVVDGQIVRTVARLV